MTIHTIEVFTTYYSSQTIFEIGILNSLIQKTDFEMMLASTLKHNHIFKQPLIGTCATFCVTQVYFHIKKAF